MRRLLLLIMASSWDKLLPWMSLLLSGLLAWRYWGTDRRDLDCSRSRDFYCHLGCIRQLNSARYSVECNYLHDLAYSTHRINWPSAALYRRQIVLWLSDLQIRTWPLSTLSGLRAIHGVHRWACAKPVLTKIHSFHWQSHPVHTWISPALVIVSGAQNLINTHK